MFDLDLTRYRLVDLSYEVVPPGSDDRPFVTERGYLADGAYKFDVLQTHTHVGTHVEAPSHFFDAGKSITDLPLTAFFGRAILLSVKLEPGQRGITPEYLAAAIGDVCRPGDVVVARNDTPREPGVRAPYFGPGAAEWLRDRRIKMLVLGDLGMGDSLEATRHFHDVLQSQDVCFVEFLSNLEALSRREFFFMALPFKVRGMDSGWARAVAIEEI